MCGSLLLSVQCGGNRYRHIEQIRGDAVTADLLGMDRILSADALRRAVQDIAADERGQAWVADPLLESLLPVVRLGPWTGRLHYPARDTAASFRSSVREFML